MQERQEVAVVLQEEQGELQTPHAPVPVTYRSLKQSVQKPVALQARHP